MATEKAIAYARVKVLTEFGKYCLREIRGLKEGTVLKGTFNPVNNAFDFPWDRYGAMLWIGQDGILISEEEYNAEFNKQNTIQQ